MTAGIPICIGYVLNDPVNEIDPSGLLMGLPSPADKVAAERVKREHPELWKGKNDKFAHCALACQIAKECGPWVANNAAAAKEVWDAIDNNLCSHSEAKDFDAGLDGIRIAVHGRDCVSGCVAKGYNP